MHNVFTHAELLALGRTRNEIQRLVRLGALTRLCHGVYAFSVPDAPELQHRQLVAACRRTIGSDKVTSHVSAAVLHGIPVPRRDLRRATFTSLGTEHGSSNKHVIIRATALALDDVVDVEGNPTTSLVRTAADVARTQRSMGWAVATLDAALRLGATPTEIEHMLDKHERLQGRPQALSSLRLASPLAESPLESLSRVHMLLAGFPPPKEQVDLHDEQGFVGRIDFLWPDEGIAGEADGMMKFDELLADGETATDRVRRIHRRDQRLLALGYLPVHWGWDDAQTPQAMQRVLQPAFREARRRLLRSSA